MFSGDKKQNHLPLEALMASPFAPTTPHPSHTAASYATKVKLIAEFGMCEWKAGEPTNFDGVLILNNRCSEPCVDPVTQGHVQVKMCAKHLAEHRERRRQRAVRERAVKRWKKQAERAVQPVPELLDTTLPCNPKLRRKCSRCGKPGHRVTTCVEEPPVDVVPKE